MKKLILACLMLGVSGCGNTRPTAEWVDQLRAPDSSARLHAIKALEKRQGEDDVIVPALTAVLSDADPFVRRDAALALGRLKAQSTTARAALTARTEDSNAGVRRASAEALRQIALASTAPNEMPGPP
jgi:HEAT repeat protein